MSFTYKTKVNGTMNFEITQEELDSLDVISTTPSSFHLLISSKSYHPEIIGSDFLSKSYNVRVNNNAYEVTISDELDQLISEMGFSLGGIKHVHDIKAPMPGLILDINVTIGQAVKEDDPLLVLEAMKMENVIASPKEGIIKSIVVTKGQAVVKDTLLIEFE
ncbi:hypothetical protein NBRC110019_26770 [Neptunitalea chrysea]|uniref:Lipoyl-binding domain-containing protein n=1 Tax=Neptunitalea chrysea TaxID=1647581 RepID=A0A9W6B6W4_9FLAO|nr:biotin/lipoyl-containing protein [Neptunitalea chrysea]GLB53636.1 hypothetical protein NBRC110019_26770 [Neptunitalea chrysea]